MKLTGKALRQFHKNTAINSIIKIYHPKSSFKYRNNGWDESYSEQRDYAVRLIVQELLKKMEEV